MKIAKIHAAGLRGVTPKGGWSHEIQPDDSVHTLIAVATDGGVIGYGSVFSDPRLVSAAIAVLEPLYRDETALEPERVTEKLRQHSFWMGFGGTMTHAISGIDIALWDLFGKAVGQPVGRLLGGTYRDRVQPYASLLMQEPAAMGELVEQYRAQGFRAIKIGWGPFGRRGSYRLDEQIVAAARAAAGDECRLMVDAGGSDAYWPNGLKWAVRTADMLAAHDVEWFEEPLQPDDIEGFIELRRAARLPIAGGEVLTRRQTFVPWLTRRAFDVVQPDVTKVGGISEQRRIAWLAADCGVRYIGHGWNTALGLAADLQLAAALPSADLVEYIGGSPYVDEITQGGWKIDDEGYLAIPDAPGLGIEVDVDAVMRYTDDAELAALLRGR